MSEKDNNAVTLPNQSGRTATTSPTPIEVSVIIKTLNEAANIARTIESAMQALDGVQGEIIVADSLSQDATVQIAAEYPVTVVQLTNPGDRCCGAGPQLGFQYAKGEFIYILDGDMELKRGFLTKAVHFLREHPDMAGVAGIVEELGGGNYEFEARKSQSAEWSVPGVQRWLDMGGLYRRASLLQVGYFSNRNLHACEEQELGLRLNHLRGRLVRLSIPSVRHHGRREDSWSLMKRRLASRYSDGPGELLHAMLGTPLFWPALRSHGKLAAMAGLWLATAVGLILLPWSAWPLVFTAVLLSILFLLMLARKRSLSAAGMGFINWQMRTTGFVRGLLSPQISPRTRLESKLIAERSLSGAQTN